MDIFSALPEHIRWRILENIPLFPLRNLVTVSSLFHNTITNEIWWLGRYRDQFGTPSAEILCNIKPMHPAKLEFNILATNPVILANYKRVSSSTISLRDAALLASSSSNTDNNDGDNIGSQQQQHDNEATAECAPFTSFRELYEFRLISDIVSHVIIGGRDGRLPLSHPSSSSSSSSSTPSSLLSSGAAWSGGGSLVWNEGDAKTLFESMAKQMNVPKKNKRDGRGDDDEEGSDDEEDDNSEDEDEDEEDEEEEDEEEEEEEEEQEELDLEAGDYVVEYDNNAINKKLQGYKRDAFEWKAEQRELICLMLYGIFQRHRHSFGLKEALTLTSIQISKKTAITALILLNFSIINRYLWYNIRCIPPSPEGKSSHTDLVNVTHDAPIIEEFESKLDPSYTKDPRVRCLRLSLRMLNSLSDETSVIPFVDPPLYTNAMCAALVPVLAQHMRYTPDTKLSLTLVNQQEEIDEEETTRELVAVAIEDLSNQPGMLVAAYAIYEHNLPYMNASRDNKYSHLGTFQHGAPPGVYDYQHEVIVLYLVKLHLLSSWRMLDVLYEFATRCTRILEDFNSNERNIHIAFRPEENLLLWDNAIGVTMNPLHFTMAALSLVDFQEFYNGTMAAYIAPPLPPIYEKLDLPPPIYVPEAESLSNTVKKPMPILDSVIKNLLLQHQSPFFYMRGTISIVLQNLCEQSAGYIVQSSSSPSPPSAPLDNPASDDNSTNNNNNGILRTMLDVLKVHANGLGDRKLITRRDEAAGGDIFTVTGWDMDNSAYILDWLAYFADWVTNDMNPPPIYYEVSPRPAVPVWARSELVDMLPFLFSKFDAVMETYNMTNYCEMVSDILLTGKSVLFSAIQFLNTGIATLITLKQREHEFDDDEDEEEWFTSTFDALLDLLDNIVYAMRDCRDFDRHLFKGSPPTILTVVYGYMRMYSPSAHSLFSSLLEHHPVLMGRYLLKQQPRAQQLPGFSFLPFENAFSKMLNISGNNNNNNNMGDGGGGGGSEGIDIDKPTGSFNDLFKRIANGGTNKNDVDGDDRGGGGGGHDGDNDDNDQDGENEEDNEDEDEEEEEEEDEEDVIAIFAEKAHLIIKKEYLNPEHDELSFKILQCITALNLTVDVELESRASSTATWALGMIERCLVTQARATGILPKGEEDVMIVDLLKQLILRLMANIKMPPGEEGETTYLHANLALSIAEYADLHTTQFVQTVIKLPYATKFMMEWFSCLRHVVPGGMIVSVRGACKAIQAILNIMRPMKNAVTKEIFCACFIALSCCPYLHRYQMELPLFPVVPKLPQPEGAAYYAKAAINRDALHRSVADLAVLIPKELKEHLASTVDLLYEINPDMFTATLNDRDYTTEEVRDRITQLREQAWR